MLRTASIAACAVGLVVSGCGAASHKGASRSSPDQPAAAELSFDRAGWKTDFSRHSVPLSEFVSGGPPRDGIPPVDHPRFLTVARADGFLSDREPVIALEAGGQARAYPIQILVWHEIVNDRLGDVPVAVTYCPLCNSALVYDRRAAARTLNFGTTGNLRRSDLVMWDRQTQSWWQQIGGQGVVGRLTGTTLRPLPALMLGWGEFKRRFPDASVLSRDTGFRRDYGTNPYTAYDRPDVPPFLYGKPTDPRFPPKERVIAVTAGGQTVVAPFTGLRRAPVVNTRVGAVPAVIFYARGVASPLDQTQISASRDVGTATAFERRLAGRSLTFAPSSGGFIDRQTRSRWDLTGTATAGPLRGQRLRELQHDQEFWFALAAFLPKARVIRPAS